MVEMTHTLEHAYLCQELDSNVHEREHCQNEWNVEYRLRALNEANEFDNFDSLHFWHLFRNALILGWILKLILIKKEVKIIF